MKLELSRYSDVMPAQAVLETLQQVMEAAFPRLADAPVTLHLSCDLRDGIDASSFREGDSVPDDQVTVSFLEGGRQHISGVKRFERRMWVRDPTLSGAEQFRVCADEVRPRHYGGGHICRTYKGGLLKRDPSNNATQSVADFLASQHAVSVTILAVQILKDEIYVHFEQDTPQNLAE